MDKLLAMKIYNVIVNDRHTDPHAIPFLNSYDAILCAKDKANRYCFHKEDFNENLTQDMIDAGYLYCVTYSCEGDSIWVT